MARKRNRPSQAPFFALRQEKPYGINRQLLAGSPAAGERCSSSVVEHSLGKGEVESSILSCSTIPNHPAALMP